MREDGRYDGYVPGLACEIHGGPPAPAIAAEPDLRYIINHYLTGEIRKQALAAYETREREIDVAIAALSAPPLPHAAPTAWLVMAKGGRFNRGLYQSPTAADFAIWKADGDTAIPLFAAPPLPHAAPATAADVEKVVDDYLATYATEFDEASRTPNDDDRFVIKDAIMGLLAEPEFAAALAAPPLPRAQNLDRVPFLIFFDDQDVKPEIIVGEAGARHRFKLVSGNWNAHLFVKIASNSRDDERANDNAILAAAPPLPHAAPAEPTEAMLIAARDWSHKKYGTPLGDDAAIGCWKAMLAALPSDGQAESVIYPACNGAPCRQGRDPCPIPEACHRHALPSDGQAGPAKEAK